MQAGLQAAAERVAALDARHTDAKARLEGQVRELQEQLWEAEEKVCLGPAHTWTLLILAIVPPLCLVYSIGALHATMHNLSLPHGPPLQAMFDLSDVAAAEPCREPGADFSALCRTGPWSPAIRHLQARSHRRLPRPQLLSQRRGTSQSSRPLPYSQSLAAPPRCPTVRHRPSRMGEQQPMGLTASQSHRHMRRRGRKMALTACCGECHHQWASTCGYVQ